MEVINIGNTVVCDACGDDYTESNESGGFIFGSYAYCPQCAIKTLPNIKKYNEEAYIKARCGKESFADFVRNYRGDNNQIIITNI